MSYSCYEFFIGAITLLGPFEPGQSTWIFIFFYNPFNLSQIVAFHLTFPSKILHFFEWQFHSLRLVGWADEPWKPWFYLPKRSGPPLVILKARNFTRKYVKLFWAKTTTTITSEQTKPVVSTRESATQMKRRKRDSHGLHLLFLLGEQELFTDDLTSIFVKEERRKLNPPKITLTRLRCF